jgi:type I restriction enzyme S subunit
MAGEWREIALWDIAEYINGRATKPSELALNGVPVIKIAELNRGITEETDRIPPELVEEKHWVSPGDLLFAWSGSVGIYRYTGPKAALNQHIFRVVAKPGIDQGFLRYLLLSCVPLFQLHVQDKRTTMGHVTKKDLQRIRVRIPPLQEQRAIAHILGTLDDKIELNRRMSQTLEAMARALFKAWFVDFEPVRAKMEGRWQRGQSLPGLPAHLYDLFPDRLVDSELGEIPEGWRVVRLGDFVVTIKGRSYKSKELVEGSDVALVTLKSFARGGGYRPDGLKPFAGCYKQEQVVKPGEVVVACTDVTQAAEVIGRAAMVRRSNLYSELVASLDTLIVRPKTSDMTVAFLYSLLRTDAFVEHTYAHVTGTTVLHLAKDALPSFTFALPPGMLVHVFDGIAGIICSKVETLELENDTLAALRDALLPKLIRGEIRVKDAERFLMERGL